MNDITLWGLGVVVASALATYMWRGLGVLLAARVKADSLAFVWVGCVAYALLAALIARMILLPEGPTAETSLVARVGAAGLAVAVYMLSRHNLLLAVLAGGAGLVVFGFQDRWLPHLG